MLIHIYRIGFCLATIAVILVAGACQKDPDFSSNIDTTQVIIDHKPNRGTLFIEILKRNIVGVENTSDSKEAIISIENEKGEMILNMSLIKLHSTDSSYISDPVVLKLGNYKITRLFGLDGTGKINIAAPISGSVEAAKVKKALDYYFSLNINDTLKTIIPELCEVKNKNISDFGFSEAFTIVKAIPINITVMAYDFSTQDYEIVSSTIKIKDLNSDFSATVGISDVTGMIYIKENINKIQIDIIKTGYETKSLVFNYIDLLSFVSKPLIVVLEKS